MAAVSVGAGLVALPWFAAPALAQDCRQAPEPAEVIPELPWAQHWFAPDRVWPLSRGEDVVVAVVDTGVDGSHPQLDAGQVLPGTDLLAEPVGGRVDCDSHGTAVASIIAADPADGVGFAGLAPDARILPVRVAERNQEASDPEQEPPVAPGTFAEAVRWAADEGADVLNLSVVFYRDHEAIASAVEYAVERDVIVVAAVGDLPAEGGLGPPPYPAAYPGVIGVGAIDEAGQWPDGGYAGPHVDLVAPGVAVTAAAAAGGHHQWSGSSFAAPFVSAAAALVLAADPALTAAEATRLLFATADPAGFRNVSGVHGVVNPYRALTERAVDGEPVAADPPAEPAADPAAQARSERWQRAGEYAVLLTLGVAVLGAAVAGGVGVWRRGSRRGWRPGQRQRLADAPDPADRAPEDEPQRRFFAIPTPHDHR